MARALETALGVMLLALAMTADGSATRAAPAGRGEEWLPVRDVSLEIAKGSPLDFSSLSDGSKAGDKGRILANADGSLVTQTAPDKPLRILCASLAWSPASGSYPDHATADRYAEQLKIHGYNLARLHFVDAILMSGRDRDFDLDPVQLDNFRYLLAALKRNGIYWMIDAASSENGAYGGVYPDRWTAKHDLKVQVHISEDARKHWLRLASAMLATVNPYTGARPLDDPALAAVMLFNENGLEFDSYLAEPRTKRAYPTTLREPFNDWLAATYRTTDALAEAWGGLDRGESIEQRTIELPKRHGERGPRMRDLQRFFLAREKETVLWMSTALRQLGYEGLVSAYNNMGTAQAHLSRRELPLVTLDSYHDEVLSLAPGTSIQQTSSLDDEAGYVRAMMAARWQGRPFVVSEYDHLFWNSFRREAGLVVPAYAALQGWSGICRHGMGAIDLAYGSPHPHKQKLLPYGLGLDPVARAAETVAALLYRRGDVASSRLQLLIPFAGEADLLDDGQGVIPRELTRLGLLAHVGLTDRPVAAGASSLDSAGGAEERLPRWLVRLTDRIGGGTDRAFAERIDRLVTAQRLAPTAAEEAKRRVYHSDTGEITLDAPRRTFAVVTEATEALAFERLPAPRTLRSVSVVAASAPAMLAVSALDGRPLARSRKLLIVVATDAQNTGMTFEDGSRRTVTDYGTLPVQIRRVSLRLEISVEPAETGRGEGPRLTSLHLDGTAGDRLPVNARGRTIALNIDTGTPSHGPTTFFLLER